jgi:uncharacterized membrane protein required for colicin V production
MLMLPKLGRVSHENGIAIHQLCHLCLLILYLFVVASARGFVKQMQKFGVAACMAARYLIIGSLLYCSVLPRLLERFPNIAIRLLQ